MTLVRFPSVVVEQIAEDFLDATAATVLSANAEPFSISSGQSLDVCVDGGSVQHVPLNAPDFADVRRATAAEVCQVIATWLTGVVVAVDAGHVRISTATMGSGGSVEVSSEPTVDGGPAAAFGFSPALQVGVDASAQTLLVNVLPEPNETAVELDAAIEFDLYRAGGPAPSSSSVVVRVDGVAVLNGASTWAADLSNPDASTLHVRLLPSVDHASDAPVAVSVESDGFSESWSFRTLDVLRPRTLAAVARDDRRIRVTFSEPMQQLDPTAAGDALNRDNYLIERVTRPAVSVVVERVEPVRPDAVDLITDIEMTYGAGYLLVVSSLLDVAGNAHLEAPENEVAFVGFVPPFPAGRRFVLTDFVPRMNLGQDATGDLRMLLACSQELVNVLLRSVDEWGTILDPDVAPEAFIDAMLADLGNPFDFELAEIDKRRLLRILVRLYQRKGTTPGVLDAVLFFVGVPMTIRNHNRSGWRLGAASRFGAAQQLSTTRQRAAAPAVYGPNRRGRFSFRLVSPVDLTDEQREIVRKLAVYMKPAREHYLGTIEPKPPPPPDHLALGYSRLGMTGFDAWRLHAERD